MPRRRRTAALSVLALAAVAVLPALAGPLRPAPAAAQAVGRIFPDPVDRGDFLQYGPAPTRGYLTSEYLEGLAELEEAYGDVVEVQPIHELVGGDEVRSPGGREIPVITLTDESVPDEGKVDLYFSMSIHGLERAGLEGGLRFIEDVAIGAQDDSLVLDNGAPDREGYREVRIGDVLRRARMVFTNLNPDGWAAGDRVSTDPGPGYQRGNANGIDLNRQWPTIGWASDDGERYRTQSQPEAIAGRALIEEHLGVPEGAADLHGELNDDVLLAIMFPAGQFDPLQLAKQVELADSIKQNVNERYAELDLSSVSVPGFPDGFQPAEFHTAYDAIGYDDSGFQGDYLVQQGILEMDHEYAFSNLIPNNIFVPALEQIHVDTTRSLLAATIVTTLGADEITYAADLAGRVAYVENPEVLTEAGARVPPPFDFPQQPYTSTSMEYYRDLAPYAGGALEPVTSVAVAEAGALSGFDTVVVTDRELPRTRVGDSPVEPDRAAFWGALRAFAEDGGNVVLTDRALTGLEAMGLVPEGSVTRGVQEAGTLSEFDRAHPLLERVEGVIGQTYFEVPLGYPFSPDSSPVWSVDSEAWQAAGGTTAALDGRGEATGLGTLGVGEGRVAVFGAVLPDATQEFAHTQGLADYAVTYAGNAILVNAMTWFDPTKPPPAAPPAPPGPGGPSEPDPSEPGSGSGPDPSEPGSGSGPDPSEPGSGSEPAVERLSGGDRFATAAAISRETFAPGVETAYIATGADHPDAVAAGAAAAHDDAPVLLVAPDAIPEATVEELRRLQPERVVVVGGTSAIDADVEASLAAFAPQVTRVGGAERLETAARLSAATFPAGGGTPHLATASTFPDALTAGAAAAASDSPVLLTGRDELAPVVEQELRRLAPDRVVVAGGTAAVGDDVASAVRSATGGEVVRVGGADRFETAARLSEATFATASTAFLATGAAFPDALAGVPAAAAAGAPVLLVAPDALPDPTAAELRRLSPSRTVLLGGSSAVEPGVEDAVRDVVGAG